MNTTILLSIALVLFLVALPLTSFGAMEENEVIWGAGLALLVVAGLIPPASRFLGGDDDGDGDGKAEDDASADGDEQAEDDGKADDDAKADDDGKPEADDEAEDDGDARARRAGSGRETGAATPPAHPRAIEPPEGRDDTRADRRRAREQRKRAGNAGGAGEGDAGDRGRDDHAPGDRR
jgi:hypothetical protein